MDEMPRRRVRIKNRNIVEPQIQNDMEDKTRVIDETFFGANGCTSTSVMHNANTAQERVRTKAERLGGIKLYNTNIKVLGDSTVDEYSKGWGLVELSAIEPTLDEIGMANAYKAYVCEAIKQRERNIEIVESMELEEYCAIKGIDMPVMPVMARVPSKEEILAGMTIKERNKIYMLQAMASTYGKYLHPSRKHVSVASSFELDESFANTLLSARTALSKVKNNPRRIVERTNATVMYIDEPNVESEVVEDVYMGLMAKYRKYQGELNGYLNKIDRMYEDAKSKASREYAQAYADYEVRVKALRAEMTAYIESEVKRMREEKIVIPNDLKSLHDELNALGK
jgi:hypothetical protein